MTRPALICTLLLLGCPEKVQKIVPPPDSFCGDGIIDTSIGEECEGSDFGSATCETLGYDTGTLSCDAQCHLVKTLCVKLCGNGVVDGNEGCDGDAGLPGCTTFGYVSCTSMCTIDRTHCVTTPFQAGPALELPSGGPGVVADLAPAGLGDLIVVEQEPSPRVATYPYTVESGFDLSGVRTLSFGASPIAAIGSGFDIVALNANGSLDRYVYSGTGFMQQPYTQGGCSGALVGEVASHIPLTGSCDGGELLAWDTSLLRAPTNGGVLSIVDFNGDGQPDVLALNGTALEIHLAPGFAATDGGTLPSVITSLVAGDFDGDGDLDLAGISGGSIKLIENVGTGWADRMTISSTAAVNLRAADLDLDGRVDLVWESGSNAEIRRNQGSWVFATFEAPFGAGANVSLSVGDVDGDGDLDLVSTRAGSGTATVSYVQLNQVKQ